MIDSTNIQWWVFLFSLTLSPLFLLHLSFFNTDQSPPLSSSATLYIVLLLLHYFVCYYFFFFWVSIVSYCGIKSNIHAYIDIKHSWLSTRRSIWFPNRFVVFFCLLSSTNIYLSIVERMQRNRLIKYMNECVLIWNLTYIAYYQCTQKRRRSERSTS